jgi:hypothetical protein
MKLFLAQHSLGRVVLHVGCLLRDGRLRSHWAGVMRELYSHSASPQNPRSDSNLPVLQSAHRMKNRLTLVVLLAFAALAPASRAQLASVSPFPGYLTESFESFPTSFTTSPLSIMGGAASVQTLDGISVYEALSWNFFGVRAARMRQAALAVPTARADLDWRMVLARRRPPSLSPAR